MQNQQLKSEYQAPRLAEHSMTVDGQATIIASPSQQLSSHNERVEFYNGRERMSLQTKQIYRVRELQECNDNLQRQIIRYEKNIPTSQDPLTVLAEVEQCRMLIARNTGEVLNIYVQNERRLKRIAQLEAQNIELQQDMSDNQSRFASCNENSQRTRHAADFFSAKAQYEKNLAEIQELSQE